MLRGCFGQVLTNGRQKQANHPAKRAYRMTSNIKIDGDNLVIAKQHGISIAQVKQMLKDAGKL